MGSISSFGVDFEFWGRFRVLGPISSVGIDLSFRVLGSISSFGNDFEFWDRFRVLGSISSFGESELTESKEKRILGTVFSACCRL